MDCSSATATQRGSDGDPATATLRGDPATAMTEDKKRGREARVLLQGLLLSSMVESKVELWKCGTVEEKNRGRKLGFRIRHSLEELKKIKEFEEKCSAIENENQARIEEAEEAQLKATQLQETIERLEVSLSNLETENQVLCQQALVESKNKDLSEEIKILKDQIANLESGNERLSDQAEAAAMEQKVWLMRMRTMMMMRMKMKMTLRTIIHSSSMVEQYVEDYS
ncbi:uncharacterized protein DS421_9g262890 [Arachis hypogaea]|nr:uncharacterized protein DS421_9g262890 [Arachis hypogaea]